MHKAFLFALVALLAVAAFADDSDVFIATSDNFDEMISDNEFVFVEFYAPWCGHCKKLAPAYETVATTLKDQGSKVVIASLDATEHTGPANTYGVRGYPTLKFFRNGNAVAYEGDRSAAAILQWIEKKSGPATVELSTQEAVDAFKAKGGVIAYIADAESTEFKNWMRAATSGQLDDFVLGHVHDAALSGDNVNTAVIYKEDGETIAFDGDKFSKTKIVAWINAEGYPLFEEISQPVWQRSQTANTPLLALFIDTTDAKQNALVKEIAVAFKGKVVVSVAPTATQKSLAERWGASGNFFPTAVLANWKGSTNPTMSVFNEETETALTVESASAFVEAGLAGTYENFMKSEPIPENNDGPVVTLVGRNFKEIVTDSDDDVFVEFYAPWCGHCKKLAPVYSELGETFASVEHIKIAQIDATANNLPSGIDVKGYPTLILFKGGKQIPFNGDRDLEAMTNFLVEQSSKPVKLGKDDL
eukprot:TRINITY_DN4_c0_g1_i1.p1 TRINITY_DN4_c0_g1~~TRINITY_DN4_c0_g1_i1.p1  ORF type:complete len:474 (-),score=177.59 TRINITY_DN4_c0_g1_i1:75-1496(-)